MKTTLLTLTALVLAACGPNTAQVGTSMEGEADELGTTTGELALSNKADFWFPMEEGNTWTLVAPSGASKKVGYSGVYEGVGFVDGLINDGRWMGTSPSAPNSLYSWNEADNTWSTFIRFGYAVTGWKWGQGACNEYKVKRSATGITVTTPAGTFSDARTIKFERQPSPTARCMMPAFTELTFAPNVGLIAINTDSEKFLLTSAFVGGKVIPAVGGIKGSLKLDKVAYVNKPNTIVCITTPCPGNDVTAVAKATYTVTNTGTKSETWQFTSGCQFDVQLVDQTGKVVRSLAENRFCTLSLTQVTLAPGQSKTYTADLTLANRIGEQLFGTFTAKANLTPSNATFNAASSASFTVTKP